MKTTRSLSVVVAAWTAAGIAVSMALYAVLQYYLLPAETVGSLFLRHLWHVAALGVVVYAICWFGFRRVLVRPILHLQGHLYGIATGHADPVSLNSRITELRSLEQGVNLMIRRMQRDAEMQNPADLLERTAAMRDIVYSLLAEEPLVASPILDELAHLEGALLAVCSPVPQPIADCAGS